jgi:hypothetical protein
VLRKRWGAGEVVAPVAFFCCENTDSSHHGTLIIKTGIPSPRAHPTRRPHPPQILLLLTNPPLQPPHKHLPHNSPRKPPCSPLHKHIRNPLHLCLNPRNPPSRMGHPLLCLSRRPPSRDRPRRYPLHRLFPSPRHPQHLRWVWAVRKCWQ